MKFPYKLYGREALRPVIPIEIRYRSEAVRYEVLVDSGADINVLPAEIGELLGIAIERGTESRVGGITGGGMSYFLHPVTIRVGELVYQTEIGFMPDMPSLTYGVVGQRGFFDLFRSITFDVHRGEIEIRP